MIARIDFRRRIFYVEGRLCLESVRGCLASWEYSDSDISVLDTCGIPLAYRLSEHRCSLRR